MRVYETRLVPAHEEKVIVSRTCDLCKAPGGIGWDYSEWQRFNNTSIRVSIVQKEGYNYGTDGGRGIMYDIDLCPTCFKDRLVPWLVSQGAVIDPIDWDF